MNYPGRQKKEYTKVVNYKNRGMQLESLINEANQYYLEKDAAIIYKKPTPIAIVKSNGTKITDAYFKEASTLDYCGIYNKKYIEFDAKSTQSKTSLALSNIHDHQLKHIQNIINHGGVTFLIILINNEYFLYSGKRLIDFIKSNERKSIPYSEINKKEYKLEYNYLKGLDYLQALNHLIKEEFYEEN